MNKVVIIKASEIKEILKKKKLLTLWEAHM